MLRYTLLLLIALGCRPGLNYRDPASPRYSGPDRVLETPSRSDTLRIVSFNIEYAKETRRAAGVLSTAAALRDADIILLQEMTAPATKVLADSLRMRYVYYPAIYNRIKRRDIGNAILSRWPITDDAKLILPNRSRYARTQRIATAATIRFGTRSIRVYSTHFGTPADLGWKGRVEQLRGILDDASPHPQVVIGGDMNSKDIGRIARESGYTWPTDTIPKSNDFGRLDHFFIRGLTMLSSGGAGTHRVPRSISDHSPIWIRVRLPQEASNVQSGANSTRSIRKSADGLEYRVRAEVVRQGYPFLDVTVTALNPTSRAVHIEIPDCAVNVLVHDRKDSTRKVLWSSWRQKYPGPPRATGRTCRGGVIEMELKPGDSIRGGPLSYQTGIDHILGDTIAPGEYPAEVIVDVSRKRSTFNFGALSINRLPNGERRPLPRWPSHLDSSLANVEFTLASGVEGVAPASFGVHVTAHNRGRIAAHLSFGDCALTVFGYRSAERAGIPVWRSDRAAPPWVKTSGRACLLYLANQHIMPGESISPREFNTLIPTYEILGDSLAEGMYYFRANLKVNERTFPLNAGSARVMRRQRPLPSARTYYGISYSASARRVASRQSGPDSLEFAITIRNTTRIEKTIRGEGCVPVAGFNSAEARDSSYMRPAWAYHWHARPCPLHLSELTVGPGEKRILRGRTAAPASRMHYVVWFTIIVTGEGDQREGESFTLGADEQD